MAKAIARNRPQLQRVGQPTISRLTAWGTGRQHVRRQYARCWRPAGCRRRDPSSGPVACNPMRL